MNQKKIVLYSALILTIILVILLSMLNFNDSNELEISKWAVSAIISLGVVSLSVMTPIKGKSWAFVATQSIIIPLLSVAMAGVIFALVNRDDLFQKLVLENPIVLGCMIFIVSFAAHVTRYIFIKNQEKVQMQPNERNG